MTPYQRGYLRALRDVRKWLHECWKRNVDFQVQWGGRNPKAPRYQLLTAKYAALTQESHIMGLDHMIEKQKKRAKR